MIMYENLKFILSFHLKQNFVMKAISQVLTEKGSRYTWVKNLLISMMMGIEHGESMWSLLMLKIFHKFILQNFTSQSIKR